MTRNTNNIVYSGVADPFIPDQVRYHCPVILLLKFVRPSLKSYTRKIWTYSQADFDKYRELLTEYHLENAAEQADIEDSVQITQAAILKAAEKSIPNKLVVIRPNDYPWITCFIKSLIRKRRRLYRKFKRQTICITGSGSKHLETKWLIMLENLRQNIMTSLK